MEMIEPSKEASARANARDEQFFAQNPERSFHVRPLLHGEWMAPIPLAGDGWWYVAVYQPADGSEAIAGCRSVRAAVILPEPPLDTEENAQRIFAAEMQRASEWHQRGKA